MVINMLNKAITIAVQVIGLLALIAIASLIVEFIIWIWSAKP